MRKKVNILDVRVDNLTVEELEAGIMDFAASKGVKVVMYANANSINLAKRDVKFREILNSADILHSDGWGVIWASRFFKTPLKEKIVVTDFFVDFCEKLAKRGLNIYLLGGKPGVAEKAKARLRQAAPSLNIVGENHGYFDEKHDKELVNKINDSRPDILIVGMGTSRQEKWIYRNRHHLQASLCWAVGGLLDFISGEIKRAPAWMCNTNLEWLYRLYREPQRLWKRYLMGNLIFTLRVAKIVR